MNQTETREMNKNKLFLFNAHSPKKQILVNLLNFLLLYFTDSLVQLHGIEKNTQYSQCSSKIDRITFPKVR